MRHRIAAPACLLALTVIAGCSRSPGVFTERNARAHVEMLASTIGSRPAGSEANARARAYIVDQLRTFGFQVRVQETDARRPELGRTARVANIIGVLPGARREAVGLLSHYDSGRENPGGGDDAFGVAVSLEAARVIASLPNRQWTTYVLVSDAEEEGLMGAAALMTDPQVRDYLSAYLNVEAVGTSRPVMLFETGPGNAWLVSQWAKHAPSPRGGSFATEIYRRLPNDTDFSILRRHEIPGLNFAAVGDSHAYHTSRDTADRVTPQALRDAGDNVVAIVRGLQGVDITTRSDAGATYFDIGGTVGVAYGPVVEWTIAALAVLLGVLGWARQTRYLVHAEGFGRWLLGLVWVLLTAALSIGAMTLAAGALRMAREVYHPWYARPGRLFILLAVAGLAAAWAMARAGRWIPARAHGLRHPAVVWTYALPAWIAATLIILWSAPAAAYLWTLPLLAAGLCLLVAPPRFPSAVRLASLVVFAVAATLWLRLTLDLLPFVVAVFGRLPIVTPVYVYPLLVAVAGLMLLPPLLGAVVRSRPLGRPALATGLALAALAGSFLAAWTAPAYTETDPLRRYVRALQEPDSPTALWKIGSLEPGLDLGPGAPDGWSTTEPTVRSIPWGRLPQPFVFSAAADPLGPVPASITSFTIEPAADGAGTTLSLSVLPAEPSLTISFVLPDGVTPVRSSFPGIVRLGRWTATYVAPPPEGIAWQATFTGTSPEALRQTRVAVTAGGLAGGQGWQRLPAWLPQERMAWTGWFTWVLDPSAPPPIAPVPPLR